MLSDSVKSYSHQSWLLSSAGFASFGHKAWVCSSFTHPFGRRFSYKFCSIFVHDALEFAKGMLKHFHVDPEMEVIRKKEMAVVSILLNASACCFAV